MATGLLDVVWVQVTPPHDYDFVTPSDDHDFAAWKNGTSVPRGESALAFFTPEVPSRDAWPFDEEVRFGIRMHGVPIKDLSGDHHFDRAFSNRYSIVPSDALDVGRNDASSEVLSF